MKHYVWLVALVAALAVTFTGCSKKPTGVDTGKLEKTFEKADTTTQSTVNKAVVAIQSEDYPAATAELQKLSSNTKITPEQQQAVKDALEAIKKQVSEQVDKAKDTAKQAVPK